MKKALKILVLVILGAFVWMFGMWFALFGDQILPWTTY